MQAKNRKILIVASSIVVVGGIIGGTIGAAIALTSNQNEEKTQTITPANSFYSTGEYAFWDDTTGSVSRWTPIGTNPNQKLFYIATGEQDVQAFPQNIIMTNPTPEAIGGAPAGDYTTVQASLGWESLGSSTGQEFVTQPDYEGLYQNNPWNDKYVTSAFMFRDYWADPSYSTVPITYLSPVAYDRGSQTYDVEGKLSNSYVEWAYPESESKFTALPIDWLSNEIEKGSVSSDNFRVTSIEPTYDSEVWGFEGHSGHTFTHSRIGFNEDGYWKTNANGDFVEDPKDIQGVYINTSPSAVVDNQTVKSTYDKALADDLFLFPILTVEQTFDNVPANSIGMYMTFGGFQTETNNEIQYRVVEYGTDALVKDWTSMGTHQQMDNKYFEITGLTEGKTYKIQFSSDFAYHNWAEYKFSVGDAPDTYQSSWDFYAQFPDASAEYRYGKFYLVDPNTGLAVNYEKPDSTTASEKNKWVWGSGTSYDWSPTGMAEGGVSPVFSLVEWWNYDAGGALQMALYSTDGRHGGQYSFFSDDGVLNGRNDIVQWNQPDVDHSNNDTLTYNVTNNNVVQFGSLAQSNTTTLPEWNKLWYNQMYSDNEIIGGAPSYIPNTNTDISKPGGTEQDGFILIPFMICSETIVNHNSVSFTWNASAYQNTTYNLYYTIETPWQGESEMIYLDSFSGKMTKKYTINNLLPGVSYQINFYISNAANSTLFPEVANKYYHLNTAFVTTTAITDTNAEFYFNDYSEAEQEFDSNKDGDETDAYINFKTESTNTYVWEMQSSFYLNIYDENNTLIYKIPLIENYFIGADTHSTFTINSEQYPLPVGYYKMEVVQIKGDASQGTIEHEDMYINGNVAIGEISSISDEATLGVDVNGDSDMTDAAIEWTTNSANAYESNWSTSFTIDVYDKTNQQQLISGQEISDTTIFEGQGTSNWFAVDTLTWPQSELTITITQHDELYSQVLVDTVYVDNR